MQFFSGTFCGYMRPVRPDVPARDMFYMRTLRPAIFLLIYIYNFEDVFKNFHIYELFVVFNCHNL